MYQCACMYMKKFVFPFLNKNHQQLLTMAGKMGMTGGHLLVLAKEVEVDPKTQEALISMAKAVASATAALITNVRKVTVKCKDQALQNQVITAAKETAMAASALITCTRILVPCINSLFCQEQLIEACKNHSSSVEKIVVVFKTACEDRDALRDLGVVTTAVTEALNSLIQLIKEAVLHRDTGNICKKNYTSRGLTLLSSWPAAPVSIICYNKGVTLII